MKELKKYLTINGVFSGLTGLSMILFVSYLNNFFNISNNLVFPVIGVNLLVFAAFVLFVSQKQLTNKLLVNIISGLDALWVLGSAIIVLFGLFNLSSNGNVLILIVAVWIGFLGYKQYKHNK